MAQRAAVAALCALGGSTAAPLPQGADGGRALARPAVGAGAAAGGRCGFKVGEDPARCVCHPKADALDADMGDALSWLCGQRALAGCAAINPGGDHYQPNTIRDHANWAFEQWYTQTPAGDKSYASCFFASGAYLSDSVDHKPPLGHFELTKNGHMLYPTPAKSEGATDSIPKGQSMSFVSAAFSGNWIGSNSKFSVWLAGATDGCRAHAEISYDFDADGRPDRTEVYMDTPAPLRVLPEYEAYTHAIGTDDSTHGDYTAMKGGTVTLTIFNQADSAGAIQVVVSTPGGPSFVTAPFHEGAAVNPPPPPPPIPAGDCPTWYETSPRISSAHPHFRNVKNAPYSARGDANFDDWGPINMALTDGRQPWRDATTQPAVVYFPAGTYRIRDTLPNYMYTHMIGNHDPQAKCRSTIELARGSTAHFAIVAAPNFDGPGVDNFYHQIQNIDVVVGNADAMAIHWKVAQGTNLRNMTFHMDGADTAIFIENGGGGFIGDVRIIGGKTGLDIGGQQWMIRNLSVERVSVMAINVRWNWGFVFIGTHISNCPSGFSGGDDDNPSIHGGIGDSIVGSVVLVDTTFENVKVGIVEKYPELSTLIMDRVTADSQTEFLLKGPHSEIAGSQSVRLYRQGWGYENGQKLSPFLRDIPNKQNGKPSTTSMPPIRPDTPMENRPLPPWQSTPVANVVNVLAEGCRGDGVADDSTCLQSALSKASDVVFLPSGTYLLSKTVTVPAGVTLVGEAWSELKAKAGAPTFMNRQAPQPMLVLASGARRTSLSNLMFTVAGDVPGCILLQWRAADVSIWDVHWRLMYSAYASVMLLPEAGGYMENSWVWTADHDVDGVIPTLKVDVPHGLVSESVHPTWFVGVAVEHHSLAQFNFTGAQHQTLFMAQTETPYWQDPPTAWMFDVKGSSDLAIYGAVGENWYNGVQVHMNQIEGCHSCTVFSMSTKSEKTRDYSDPQSYAMDGDHTIESRKDTGTCSNYAVDTYP